MDTGKMTSVRVLVSSVNTLTTANAAPTELQNGVRMKAEAHIWREDLREAAEGLAKTEAAREHVQYKLSMTGEDVRLQRWCCQGKGGGKGKGEVT
eukprot:CAMPEP_0173313652 /NCGR_PEP_ID=MMETSP1143-20121109/24870_1 /TAXON_ID=483371 /ORGANISM="non described non described, Strain CCMP2298" /LENGTH=94 /DNA_ID=CAMNT_0014256109 /DNA_START=376 /DNA_END=662 /DNA_ORIENTATION=+